MADDLQWQRGNHCHATHTHTPVCVAVLPNTVIASILTKRFIERTYPPEKHIQWEDSVVEITDPTVRRERMRHRLNI